ncbi:hypothetical protein [Streptococcus mitis]|uniref:hypothetical protein n=1 Tax=Streptococcus mitis TaxID=28037 RepID=UPI000F68F930|nr:hypothetical protein [Streptococcus mitis]
MVIIVSFNMVSLQYTETTGYCEQDLLLLSDDLMSRLYRDLEQLDKKAQRVIQDNCPNEAISELELTELIFDKSGSDEET